MLNLFFISGGRWSISNGGVTYTFRNGISVTGTGSLRPKSVGIKVSIPFGRKRRAVEEQPLIQISEDDKLGGVEELDQPEAATQAIPQRTEESREKCAECVEIKPIKIEDGAIENATLAANDFVMIVKFIEENKSVAKMEASVKFEVTQVVKSPIDTVKVGEIFTINAKLATCPCLKSLEPDYYVVTGSMDSQNRLVLSNVLLEFES